MLYWMSAKSKTIVTRAQLVHAIKRNFSGFDEFDPFEFFVRQNFPGFKVCSITVKDRDILIDIFCGYFQRRETYEEDSMVSELYKC